MFLLGSENLYCLVNRRGLELSEEQHFCSWKTWWWFEFPQQTGNSKKKLILEILIHTFHNTICFSFFMLLCKIGMCIRAVRAGVAKPKAASRASVTQRGRGLADRESIYTATSAGRPRTLARDKAPCADEARMLPCKALVLRSPHSPLEPRYFVGKWWQCHSCSCCCIF